MTGKRQLLVKPGDVGLVLFGLRGWDNRSHLEDLGSCLELVALIPVCQEVNGLAHVVSGILDLGTAPTTHKTKVY